MVVVKTGALKIIVKRKVSVIKVFHLKMCQGVLVHHSHNNYLNKSTSISDVVVKTYTATKAPQIKSENPVRLLLNLKGVINILLVDKLKGHCKYM